MIQVQNVPGDGNCFFYSLYRAAKDRGLLQRLAQCFPLSDNSSCMTQRRVEQDFVQCMRTAVSSRILLVQKTIVRQAYGVLLEVGMEGAVTMLSDYTDETKRAFVKATTSHGMDVRAGAKQFAIDVSKAIRKDCVWVDHLHFNVINDMLDKASDLKIRVVVIGPGERQTSRRVQETLGYYMSDPHALVLVNDGGFHYKYALSGDANATSSATSRRRSSSPGRGPLSRTDRTMTDATLRNIYLQNAQVRRTQRSSPPTQGQTSLSINARISRKTGVNSDLQLGVQMSKKQASSDAKEKAQYDAQIRRIEQMSLEAGYQDQAGRLSKALHNVQQLKARDASRRDAGKTVNKGLPQKRTPTRK